MREREREKELEREREREREPFDIVPCAGLMECLWCCACCFKILSSPLVHANTLF